MERAEIRKREETKELQVMFHLQIIIFFVLNCCATSNNQGENFTYTFTCVASESRSDVQSGQSSSQPGESERRPSAFRDASLHDQRGSDHRGET